MIPDVANYEIIDVHTHPFLDFENGCIGPYGKPETMEEFDAEMHRVGIQRYAGAPLVKHKVTDFAEIVKLNEDALRIRDRFSCYVPGMQVHGAFPQESCAELHRLKEQEDVRYVGELVPYIMGTGAFNSPGMMTIFQEAEKLGMVVDVHDGTREEVEPVLKRCPQLKLILAHPGEPGDAKPRFEFLREYPNLYMDISGYGPFRWNMIRYAIDRCGAEKILFGSDMPTCSAGMYLYSVMTEHLTEAERKLVLAGNFKRLLGLERE